ncbi:MAG TPA: rhodanese-like domain-containing protein [Verrucomicrobiae bacterium]|nr:rhodanese-like domain-containing protein [Verrucomicrobiae bacterium]
MMRTKLNDPAKAREYFKAKIEYTTGPVELNHMMESHNENINVVDVRAADDYAKGHIPGAVSLPKNKWASFNGLQKGKLNILYCYSQTCHLAATAAVEFAAHGYPVMEMQGGFDAWAKNELKIERSEPLRAAA